MQTAASKIDPRLTRVSYEDFSRLFKAGEFGTERLGQAFCNTFGHMNAFDATGLYYLKDSVKAQAIIDQILADYQLKL